MKSLIVLATAAAFAVGLSGPVFADEATFKSAGCAKCHDPEKKKKGAPSLKDMQGQFKGDKAKIGELTAVVVNAKAGHKIPSGSAEERVLWLHVEAKDAKGKIWHLAVQKKGFPGEEWTIADAKALAYQDLGDIKGLPGFPGLPRDGEVPDGDRIFRLPYLDPQGRMTIAQWNTASLGTDYRLAPLQAVSETFMLSPREDLPPGQVTITATIWYSRLVSSVAEFMKVPAEEYQPVLINTHVSTFTVLP